ncbi:hypothetical protein UA08_08297 [Talaromyces atroroseus]|uniref:Methyltransferase domain-containing protein n=1 Tax=Talaromyces atroroseus TaxID=1441469 RepID=A0A225AF32_TALAT|nr:hypothetical protein UA08_08297 [Talaromyces atroroseus]OKL56654.1 hypothetical protein UA08_08297 [Talaromyces atroroseus]
MNVTSTQDTYRGPRHQGEYDRLKTQHELVKTAMHGKLLYSPVDLKQEHLRVLDSATAEGTWLIDLAQNVSSNATLIGTDIAPQHFTLDAERPDNVQLLTHSIFDHWPEEFQNSFDVVHQRFVLTVCSNETALDATKKLFACVKPGGCIELHEGDMLSIQEGPKHPAFTKFRDTMVNAWAAIGNQPNPGKFLVPWLEQAGAIDIQHESQTIAIGAAAEDKEQGERAVRVMLYLLEGMKKLLAGTLKSQSLLTTWLFLNILCKSSITNLVINLCRMMILRLKKMLWLLCPLRPVASPYEDSCAPKDAGQEPKCISVTLHSYKQVPVDKHLLTIHEGISTCEQNTGSHLVGSVKQGAGYCMIAHSDLSQ